jgi:glutamine cyclotransferase
VKTGAPASGRGIGAVGAARLGGWVVAALWLVAACGGSEPKSAARPVEYDYTVVNAYPHDPEAFTQGLLYRDGLLFESTGQFGSSRLRKVRLETGEVVAEHRVPDQYFAEGLVAWGSRLVQLTWQSGLGFVYDSASLDLLHTFEYPGEGWGLTHDGVHLILSDGTSNLRLLDPSTYEETGRLQVLDGSTPVSGLNELEYVKGDIYANVWPTDEIVIIAPSGKVTGRVSLKGLLPVAGGVAPGNLLNGIAYDSGGDRLFVTGKLWPSLFEIRLEPRTS